MNLMKPTALTSSDVSDVVEFEECVDEVEFSEHVDDADPAVASPTETASESKAESDAAPKRRRATASESPRRSRKKKRAREKAESVIPRTRSSFPQTWAEWRVVLRKAVIGSYGTSLLLHFLVMFALSAFYFQQSQPAGTMTTTLTEADVASEAFDGVVELSLPKAGSALAQAPLMNVPIDDPRLIPAPDVFSNTAKVQGDEQGNSEFGNTDGFQFKMPSGGKAIRKGSFAAWTVPADPKPREDYLIIVRIKVPNGAKSYRLADISGEVTGTDGFSLKVPFDPRRPDAIRTERGGNIVPVKLSDALRIVDGHAQIVISIPGAAALVKDTIQVKSRVLKEEQKLEIEF